MKPDRISMDLSVMASDTVKVGLELRCGKSPKTGVMTEAQ